MADIVTPVQFDYIRISCRKQCQTVSCNLRWAYIVEVAKEFEIVDIWVGYFPSAEAVEAYFKETYDEGDDNPISQFAADMGESFYDHDFMERHFYDEAVTDFSEAIGHHSFSASYGTAAANAFNADPLLPFNVVLLVWNREIQSPVSVFRKPDAILHYVGRFQSDPKSGRSE